MEFEKFNIRNINDFNNFKNNHEDILKLCKHITIVLNQTNDIIHYPIYADCDICNYSGSFCCSKIVIPGADFVVFTELLHCPNCDLNNRQRASMNVILNKIKNKSDILIYSYESTTKYFDILSKSLGCDQEIIGSEYLGSNYKSGDIINGIRHEDGMNLSLKDNSIDYIISNDVFEHIPDVRKTFMEVYRVLKNGGECIFTIPFHFDRNQTITRAIIENNKVKNILPAVMHGNPIAPESGSLCFYDFGWDILDVIKSFGFIDIYGIPTFNKDKAHINYDPIITFVAKK
jgi:SAM-dependent methyltransferase